ncbi:unnamed protein product [Arctogadus glacialis]
MERPAALRGSQHPEVLYQGLGRVKPLIQEAFCLATDQSVGFLFVFSELTLPQPLLGYSFLNVNIRGSGRWSRTPPRLWSPLPRTGGPPTPERGPGSCTALVGIESCSDGGGRASLTTAPDPRVVELLCGRSGAEEAVPSILESKASPNAGGCWRMLQVLRVWARGGRGGRRALHPVIQSHSVSPRGRSRGMRVSPVSRTHGLAKGKIKTHSETLPLQSAVWCPLA